MPPARRARGGPAISSLGRVALTLPLVLFGAVSVSGQSSTPADDDGGPLTTLGLLELTLTGGESLWIEHDLEPGHDPAFRWNPDQETGMPHAFMGMIAVIQVT